MSVIGSLFRLVKGSRSVQLLVILLLIAFLPYKIPPNMEFAPFTVKPARELTGALSLNTKLNNAERLFVDQVKGPEGLAQYKGELYTTAHGGYVIKMGNNKLVPIVKFGKPCDGLWQEHLCGRPLGLKFDKNGLLYVADAYYGVFSVNITSGLVNQLVSMTVAIAGKLPVLPNSVDVASDGSIYWSDSITSARLHDGFYGMLCNGDGRLLKYDPKTKTNTVLIDKLQFANGVILAEDESYVLVAETAQSRIHRYYLKGAKAGTSDVFVDALPGLPDNIKRDTKLGGFFVPLVIPAGKDMPALCQVLAPFPTFRRFLARLLYLTESGFWQINKYLPNQYCEKIIHWVGHIESIPSFMLGDRVTIVQLNNKGEIVGSLHCTDGSVSGISDIELFKGDYYLGSPFNPYLGKVKVN